MTMSDTQFYLYKRRLFAATTICAAVLALVVLALLHHGPRDSLTKDIFGVAIAVPLAAMCLFGVSALLKSGPAISITDRGIAWDVSCLFRGALGWREIRSVACVNVGATWYVNLEPHSMDAYLATQPLPRRLFHRLLLRHGWPVLPTHVPGSGLRNGSAAEIAELVRRRLRMA